MYRIYITLSDELLFVAFTMTEIDQDLYQRNRGLRSSRHYDTCSPINAWVQTWVVVHGGGISLGRCKESLDLDIRNHNA